MVRYGGVLLVSSRNYYGLILNKYDIIENGGVYAYYPRMQANGPNELQKVTL